MRILCLLFTSPVQHRGPEHMLKLVEEMTGKGNRVELFLLGDGVYNSSAALATKKGAPVVLALSQMRGIRITDCSTCAGMRGVDELIGNARLGTLEDLTEEMERADVILSYTGEE
ncbi:MAG: DsrE family protein [Thermoplasmata archaeon]|uniref:DsrE family protein n=1 Tax=Candidatus Sysuiplasma superficiale TaxID=2823368 RepID=A0A8J7YLZ5_9ARCH|nr:DsrE family protein [Candidatus Sysuiplasma superficiale]MBX8643175.1 DsrE family protein [Candidatus Sysuiplasma superficiale]MCL4346738.1 DsrE family protein [Candidatus Thermoplasmatota archaeon]